MYSLFSLMVHLFTCPKTTIYILFIKSQWFFFLCVCSELIEELVGATDLKFGRGLGNTVSRNNF